VAEWTDADILETYHLRSLLESHAAELAALKATPALVAELDQLNRQMAKLVARRGADRAPTLQAVNSRFHRAILEASGSPRLKALLAASIDMPIAVRSFFVSTQADLQQSLQHHRDVAAAIAAGDAVLAAQAMQLHLRIAANRFFQRRAEYGIRKSAA
jgi:DNA-binding GntR family transcriptional regulator